MSFVRLFLIGIFLVQWFGLNANEKFNKFCEHSIITFNANDPKLESLGLNCWVIEVSGEAHLLNNYLNPGFTVFDVGAAGGGWTRTAFQAEPNLRVLAFEPIPFIFDTYLVPTLTSYPNKLELYNFAFSDHIGQGNFYYVTNLAELSSLYFRNFFSTDVTATIVVNLDTLDHFCEVHQIRTIDYVKIDTEGAELNILKGAMGMLRRQQITALQFEYGGCYVDAKTTLKEVMKILTKADYVIFRIIPEGLMHISKWDDRLENYQLCNYFAIQSSKANGYRPVKGL